MQRKIILLLILLLVGVLRAEESYTFPEDVVIFDVWQYFDDNGIDTIAERADALYFITSLQGIVNRKAPRLYLDVSLGLFDIETKHYYDKSFRDKPVTELDKFWFDYFKQQEYDKSVKVLETSDLSVMLGKYRSEIKGLVRWDVKLPATSNLALVCAGCDSLLPISNGLGGGGLYQKIKKDSPWLNVEVDLCGMFDGKTDVVVGEKHFPSTGSAKNDVYRYMIEKYLRPGVANPFKMWFNCDASMWGEFRNPYGQNIFGYLGDKNELQQNGMYNTDYWVSQRAVIFDLLPWGDCKPQDDPSQELGTDLNTWNDILEVSYNLRRGEFGLVGGFVPWWLKYTSHTGGKHPPVATEWEFVSLLTSYNMGNDGDAAFGIANASFFQHLPGVSSAQVEFKSAAQIKYDEKKTYVAFLMLDYDGSAWFNQMPPAIYNDPNRGKLPLNWCSNPVLNERVPHVLKYLHENKTDNDFFGFSDDGASYIFLESLVDRKGRVKESGVPYYERYAKELNKRYGIKYNVFYIDDNFDADSEWIAMATRITPGGFGFNIQIQEQLINGTPVNSATDFHISEAARLKSVLESLYSESIGNNQSEARFLACRCILMTPSIIYNTVSELRKKYPDAKVEIVDVDNFYSLLKEKLVVRKSR